MTTSTSIIQKLNQSVLCQAASKLKSKAVIGIAASCLTYFGLFAQEKVFSASKNQIKN
jgi:hypothetical protein